MTNENQVEAITLFTSLCDFKNEACHFEMQTSHLKQPIEQPW